MLHALAPHPTLWAFLGIQCSPATSPSRRVSRSRPGMHFQSAVDVRVFIEGGVKFPASIKVLGAGEGTEKESSAAKFTRFVSNRASCTCANMLIWTISDAWSRVPGQLLSEKALSYSCDPHHLENIRISESAYARL